MQPELVSKILEYKKRELLEFNKSVKLSRSVKITGSMPMGSGLALSKGIIEEKYEDRGKRVKQMSREEEEKRVKEMNRLQDRVQKKVNWMLQNSDFSDGMFYEMLSEQLEVLADLLYYSDSPLVVPNTLDFQLDNLYLIKKLIADTAYFRDKLVSTARLDVPLVK